MKKQFFTKKNLALIISPVLVTCLGLGVFFGVKSNTNNKEDNEVNNQYNEIDYSYSKVFLKDKDNTLVPLTIKYEKFDSLGEELMYVTNMLKVDSKVSNSTFKGLLPSNTKVKSLELKDNVLNLNFDENFMTYDSKDELRLLESLVWTLTDFNEVDSINLYVNDERLTNMPVSNTPIKFNVDRQIGINNYLLTSSMMLGSQRVLSYYEKLIDDNYYYVPVTHYVKNNKNLSIYDLTVTTMFKDPGITSSLNVCRALQDTTMVASSVLEKEVLYLSLSEDILFDELTVSLDVYEIFKEVTCLLDEVKDVSFLIELEEVMVNGLNKDEPEQVSKIELNKYYI